MTNTWLVARSFLLPLAVAAVLPVLLVALGKVPLAYNLRHLAVRWKSTLLTALAFTLVVFLLMVMLAFVAGMERLTEAGGRPGNVIVLSEGVSDELQSYVPLADAGDVALQPGVLRDERGRPLCSREIYTVISQPGGAAPGDQLAHRLLQIRGIEDAEIAARVHGLEVRPGSRWFSAVGVRERPKSINRDRAGREAPAFPAGSRFNEQSVIEAVLGEGVARELGLSIGDSFTVGPRTWLVVGILQSAGSPFGCEIWAQRQLVGQTFGIESAYTTIILATAGADNARQLARTLSTRFKTAALWALPETEYFARMSAMNRRFLIAAYVVAALMAIGGALSVMNTQFAAVHQRAKDIGVLRVLGYTRRQLLVSFLLESLAIALLGGSAGCALGFLANGLTAASTLAGDQGVKDVVLKLVLDGKTITVGLLFALVMGILGGLLPALAATRLRPLESLR
ncbi:MAG TPA: FtsX-like permease family protein [Gemmataceae bacterium]|jgi:putative ABC transport system permease protein|nr:FtsX-like permease family protein [Gemmataceae bacterium]